MGLRPHSLFAGCLLTPALLAGLCGACSGPAGVRPLQGSQVILRGCTIDQTMIAGKTDILIEANNCPLLIFAGPISIDDSQRMQISQAPQIRVDSSFTITGTLLLEKTRISGPGQLFFGSEEGAPALVRMEDTTFGADEHGNALGLTLYGAARPDCTDTAGSASYEFSAVSVEALAGQTIGLFNMPSSLDGLTFNAALSAPFSARLGDLCVPAGKEYTLKAGPFVYEARSLKVMGHLSLPGSHLVLTGEQGLTVDGGTLVSRGAQNALARIDFAPGIPATSRRLTLRNKANGSLTHTHVTRGSILITGSDVVIRDSKISGACANTQDEGCDTPENRAAVTISGDGNLDVASSELLPAGETQILVRADEAGNSSAPRVTTSGNADDFKVATMDGRPFHVNRVLPLRAGTHFSRPLRRTLEDVTGTFESPCMSSEQTENHSFRRVFTFDNEIVPFQDSVTTFTPVRLKFVRTIINYEDADCRVPAYTSHMSGTATYYILLGKTDEEGRTPQALANRVYYEFNQLIWTYHNPSVIQALNDQNFCEVNTWQPNIPQDVTHKKCFGDGFRFHGYHDRFEIRPDRDLHLALDFDDRPDDLKDQIPSAVNRETIYRRK